jgi:hypothetical protein
MSNIVPLPGVTLTDRADLDVVPGVRAGLRGVGGQGAMVRDDP